MSILATCGIPNGAAGPLAGFEDLWHNGHVFLILGGPSIHRVVPDIRLLQERGIATFGVNNVAATIS